MVIVTYAAGKVQPGTAMEENKPDTGDPLHT